MLLVPLLVSLCFLFFSLFRFLVILRSDHVSSTISRTQLRFIDISYLCKKYFGFLLFFRYWIFGLLSFVEYTLWAFENIQIFQCHSSLSYFVKFFILHFAVASASTSITNTNNIGHHFFPHNFDFISSKLEVILYVVVVCSVFFALWVIFYRSHFHVQNRLISVASRFQ